MNNPTRAKVATLRKQAWNDVPTSPGVYLWYFPPKQTTEFLQKLDLEAGDLNLQSKGGKFPIYCGIAKNLRQRLAWHTSQRLSASALKSGYLSTLRLTLLALIDKPYFASETEIELNELLNNCLFEWRSTASKFIAETKEKELLTSGVFPLNIQKNAQPRLASSKRKLMKLRKSYKAKYL